MTLDTTRRGLFAFAGVALTLRGAAFVLAEAAPTKPPVEPTGFEPGSRVEYTGEPLPVRNVPMAVANPSYLLELVPLPPLYPGERGYVTKRDVQLGTESQDLTAVSFDRGIQVWVPTESLRRVGTGRY